MPDWGVAEFAYMAGLLDGEGNIGIYLRGSRHMGSRQKTPSSNYRQRVCVSNTHMGVLLWCRDAWGGRIDPKPVVGNRRQSWWWQLQDGKAIKSLLEGCLPYMIIKRDVALVVLEFPQGVRCNQYTPVITEDLRQQKQSLYERTLVLNRRGRRE